MTGLPTPRQAGTKRILFTARKSGTTEEKQLLECGAGGAIYKPYIPEELLGTVRELLAK